MVNGGSGILLREKNLEKNRSFAVGLAFVVRKIAVGYGVHVVVVGGSFMKISAVNAPRPFCFQTKAEGRRKGL